MPWMMLRSTYGIAPGLADEQQVVVQQRRGQGSADDLARDLVGQQPDCLRQVGAQAAGQQARPVVEFPGRLPDPAFGIGGDPHVPPTTRARTTRLFGRPRRAGHIA